MCSITSNAPITSNSSTKGISRASIWNNSAVGTRVAAKLKPSRNTSLPASRTSGNILPTPVSTKAVPQPISSKLCIPGKYFFKAHIRSWFRDSNQKWPLSTSERRAKYSEENPEFCSARATANAGRPSISAGCQEQEGQRHSGASKSQAQDKHFFI